MSITHAQRLHIRLFLEGIEVPVIAVQVQATSNGPIVASIQIPPLPEATRLLPRTLVHVFFLDLNEVSSPQIRSKGSTQTDSTKKDPTAHEQNIDKEGGPSNATDAQQQEQNNRNWAYKTLFIGEVVGFQWTKTPNRRSIVLQCEDLSNYWDYAFQWSNTDIFGPGIKAMFSGGATNLFTDITGISTKGSILTYLVTTGKCNSFPELSGLAAGIIRLIEGIGGTYFPNPKTKCKALAGQNLFFSIAELRLRLTHMVHSIEKDKTSTRLLNRSGYSGMLDRALGGAGQQTSIRTAMNGLSKVIFYEMYPQPCPMYIPGSEGEVEGVKRVKLRTSRWGFTVSTAEACIEALKDAKTRLEGLDALASDLVASEASIGGIKGDVSGVIEKITSTVPQLGRGVPDMVKSVFSTTLQKMKTAFVHVKRLRTKSPASARAPIASNIDSSITQLGRLLDYAFVDNAPKTIKPARMAQQIFKPDIWFGPPPRCNVIFPDQYYQFDYKRMFMQEPTRFLLKTNDELIGEQMFFDSYYVAPQAATTKKDHAKLMDMLTRDMLDHELFTGILPVFEKMGEFNIFAAQSGGEEDAKLAGKVSFAQRSANFLYFKYRFAARQGAVSCRFNPYVAVGFPGLIIDRYIDSKTIEVRGQLLLEAGLDPQKVTEILGTNYLGNFTAVSHAISNEGERGTTDIQLTYCRQPEERTEFLGALDTVQRVQKREDTPANRTTYVAAVSEPRLFSLGPNMGRITCALEVTDQYRNRELSLFDVNVSRVGRQNPVKVPIDVPISANSSGISEITNITGDPDKLVTFKAYGVDEEIPRYKWEQQLVPAEELIRPGWYDKIWSPAEIGKTYEEFFGIGSITDPQTIVGPDGKGRGSQGEDVQQGAAEQEQAEDAADPRGTAAASLELAANASIQQAVEFLVLAYSYVKQAGMDVEEFIRAYTWRPITTMVDIFGTSDLEMRADGLEVLKGIEGFHSRAFGPYEDLFGLVNPEIEDILGITRDSVARKRSDTRKRKYQAVQEYVTQMRFSRAILG